MAYFISLLSLKLQHIRSTFEMCSIFLNLNEILMDWTPLLSRFFEQMHIALFSAHATPARPYLVAKSRSTRDTLPPLHHQLQNKGQIKATTQKTKIWQLRNLYFNDSQTDVQLAEFVEVTSRARDSCSSGCFGFFVLFSFFLGCKNNEGSQFR